MITNRSSANLPVSYPSAGVVAINTVFRIDNTANKRIEVTHTSGATNTRPVVVIVRHTTSATPALGHGNTVQFRAKNTSGTEMPSAEISPYWGSTPTAGSETGAILIKVASSRYSGAIPSAFDAHLTIFNTGSTIVGDASSASTTLNTLTVRSRPVTAAVLDVGANGVGAGMQFQAPSSTGSIRTVANVRAVLTDVTNAAENGAYRIGLRVGGANPAEGSEHFRLSADGALVVANGTGTTRVAVDNTGKLNTGLARVANGGGAAPTLGTIGGTGPTAAAQAGWWQIQIAGTDHWIPAWT